MNSTVTTGHSTYRIAKPSSIRIVSLAIAYAVVAKLSFLLTINPGNISPLFPAAGLALAATIILGRQALVGIWLGSFAANTISFFDGTVVSAHAGIAAGLVAAGIATGAAAGAAAGAWLVGRGCRDQDPLYSGWNVLVLVLAGALGGCAVSATIGVGCLTLGGYLPGDRLGYAWMTWWAGDATGTIVTAPLALAWSRPHPFQRTLWRTVEAMLLGGLLLLLCGFVFFRSIPLAYALIPLLLWAAFRFGMRGVSTTAAATAILATIGISHGGSPFLTGTANQLLLALHAFLDVTIICALFLAGVLAERERAEQILQESEIRHRFLFDNNPMPMLIYERATLQLLATNEAFLRHYGYRPAEVLALHLTDLYPEEEKAKIAQLIPQLQGHANVGEWHHRKRDGTFITNVVFSHDLEYRGRTARVAVMTDITERIRAEAALRESEQKYRELVMLANSIILRWSRDGRITFLNEFGQRFFGYTAAEILGRHVVGTIVPAGGSHGQNLPSVMEEICANPAAFEQNVNENMRRNGERAWIAWTNRVVPNEAGEVAEILSIGVDITARKHIEEELRATQATLEERVFLRTTELAEAKERAESADRLKSAFLATMSHELRTPLNSIIGFTGIMLRGLAGPLNAEQTKQLGMVQGSARHLLSLINDVLDISKIEAGQLQIHAEPFDLLAALEKVAAVVQPLADKKGLTLRVTLPADRQPLVNDRLRVEQVLLNLLNNAIKFTERGEIILAAQWLENYRFSKQTASHSAVRITVADTGIGIKPEDMEQLFQPFRQIDSGLTRRHEGTGLGLAICRRLAGQLGGEVAAQSTWGAGSVFTFVLPLEPQTSHDTKSPANRR